jgi:hypothetical protein
LGVVIKKEYWYNRNIERARKVVIERRKKYRDLALTALGDKCVICGFTDSRALQIDHINGGGCQESRKHKEMWLYKQIIDGNTTNYQLLCANCNWIKRHERKEINLRK